MGIYAQRGSTGRSLGGCIGRAARDVAAGRSDGAASTKVERARAGVRGQWGS